MRPRAPWLRRGRIAPVPPPAAWEGEYARPEDAQLPPALRSFLRSWRARYDDFGRPASRDVRDGLDRLAVISDDEAPAAVLAVDAWTDAELATGALRAYRRAHPGSSTLPEHVLDVRQWRPQDVRSAAAAALEMHRAASGRPSTRQRDVQLMSALLSTWTALAATVPYRSFNAFAGDMFIRVTRRALGDRQLRALVRLARMDKDGNTTSSSPTREGERAG